MQELLTTLQRSAQQAAAPGDLPLLFWLFQTVQWPSPEGEPRWFQTVDFDMQ